MYALQVTEIYVLSLIDILLSILTVEMVSPQKRIADKNDASMNKDDTLNVSQKKICILITDRIMRQALFTKIFGLKELP